MKIYRRLLAYAKPYSRYILPFFVFTLIAVFFSIFQFALIIPLLNFLFNSVSPEEAQKYAHAPSFSFSGSFFKDFFYYQVYRLKSIDPQYALYMIAALIVVAVIFTNIFRYMAQRCLVNARTLLVKRLREAIFGKVNHLHLGYFTKEHQGDLYHDRLFYCPVYYFSQAYTLYTHHHPCIGNSYSLDYQKAEEGGLGSP